MTASEDEKPVVTREPGRRQLKRGAASVFEDESTKSDIHDRLFEIELQAEKIKLDKAELPIKHKRFELHQRLKGMRVRKGTASAPIKIEDDVKIEIIE